VEELRADLLKKDAEIRAARREQDRLNDALLIATREGEDAGARQVALGRLLDTIKQERDALKARLRRGWWRS
jgi:3-dehydroquinate dehydratase